MITFNKFNVLKSYIENKYRMKVLMQLAHVKQFFKFD